MTPSDAARLLDLPPDASPEQIESRFLELRAKLEDKIAKAPTPGLKEKYRESLAEITTAFETLTLAADSSSLPVLKKESGSRSQEQGVKPTQNVAPSSGLSTLDSRPSASAKKSGGKEFAVVAIIAVIVLGAGGWWVMKTKAENEEKARVAAEQKAEAERQAQLAKEQAERDRLAKEAAEKAEKERIERLFTSLRSRMAELNVAYDAQMRLEQAAERELSELKSQERDLARDQKGSPNPELRRVSAQVRAQDRLVNWMRSNLSAHPARVAKAKAEELLSARAADEAASAVDAYSTALAQLKSDIAAARSDLAVTGPLKLSSNLDETTWQLIDAFGVERSGTAPATVEDVAFGKGTLVFRRAGWPDLRLGVDYRKGTDGVVAANFPIGSLKIESTPAGARVFRGEANLGATPFEIAQLPPGPVEYRISNKGYKSRRVAGNIVDGRTLTLQAALDAGRGTDPEIILERALEELPLVTDPHWRANLALGFAVSLHKLGALPRSALAPLLDAHLAACRAITNPKTKRETLTYSIEQIAIIDLARSREWAEEAVPLFASITTPDERTTAISMVDSFYMHPEVMARMLAPMGGWFGKSDWTYLGTLAQKHRMLGQEAEAQRIANLARDPGPYGEYQNKTVNEYLAAGTTARQLIPVYLALLQGDLATAQRLFSGINGVIDWSAPNKLATGFFELGDFDTPRQIARFTTSFGTSAGDNLDFTLCTVAAVVGNMPLAESLAARQVDSKDHSWRSMSYRFLALFYLNQGRKAEARAALAKATTISQADNSTERIDTVKLLVQTDQLDAARRLASSFTVPMTKDLAWVVGASASMHAALGDLPAANRALDFVAVQQANYVDYSASSVVTILSHLGRMEDAATYLPRIKDPNSLHSARSAIALGRFQQSSESAYDEAIESAKAGPDRLSIMSNVLGRQIILAQSARYPAKP